MSDPTREIDKDNPTLDLTPPNISTSTTSSPPQQAVVAYLSIRKQPPTHVFSDEVIEVDFSIEAVRGSSDSPPTNVSIQASLLDGGGVDDAGAGTPLVITVLEEPRVSASRRTGKLKCRISCLKNDPPRSCVIRLSTKENIVSEVLTREIHIVHAKIKVIADNWNPIWYKDEGGRDKCMEVHVAVYDNRDQLAQDTCGALTLTLCYDDKSNYMLVTNQDLLRPLGTKQTHQLEGGRARVRFRIEDVSKNHQGQDFCVKIAVNNPFVAPGWTPSVSVRSKRNKRQRTSLSSGGGSGSLADSSTSLPLSSGSLLPRTVAPTATHQPTTTSHLQHHQSSSYGGSSDHPSSSTSFQQRILHESSTGAGGGSGSGISPPSASSDRPQQQQQQQDVSLRGAIHGVLQWADEVVNGLYPLQWQILGYAQHMDGTPDYSRPYHSMPNPNAQISRILTQYADQTRNQLRVIEEAVVRGGNIIDSGSISGGGSGGAATQQHLSNRDSPFPSSAATAATQDPYGVMMQQSGHPPLPHHTHRSSSAMVGMMPPHQIQQPQPLRMTTTQSQQPGSLRPPPPLPLPPPPQPVQSPLQIEGTPTPTYRDMHQTQPPAYYPYPAPGDYNLYGRPPPPPPPMLAGHYLPHSHAYPHRYDESMSDPLPVRMGPMPVATSTAKSGGGSSYNPHHRALTGTARTSVAMDDDDDDEDEEEEVEEEEEECLESNVEYVLAKQYKSLRTGRHLGFPAFSARKRILGFYRESPSSSSMGGSGAAVAGRATVFVPLRRDAIDYDEIVQQATSVLQKAMDMNSEALHSLKVWGSISSMVDHALVYDWRKDMSGDGSVGGGTIISSRRSDPSGGSL